MRFQITKLHKKLVNHILITILGITFIAFSCLCFFFGNINAYAEDENECDNSATGYTIQSGYTDGDSTYIYYTDNVKGNHEISFVQNNQVKALDRVDISTINCYILWDLKKSIYTDENDYENDSQKNLSYVGELINGFAQSSDNRISNIKVYFITSQESAVKPTGAFTVLKDQLSGLVNGEDILTFKNDISNIVEAESRTESEFTEEFKSLISNVVQKPGEINSFILLTDGSEKPSKELSRIINNSGAIVYWVDISNYKHSMEKSIQKEYDRLCDDSVSFRKCLCLNSAPYTVQEEDDVLISIGFELADISCVKVDQVVDIANGRIENTDAIKNKSVKTDNDTSGFVPNSNGISQSENAKTPATPTDVRKNNSDEKKENIKADVNWILKLWKKNTVSKILLISIPLVVIFTIAIFIIVINKRKRKKRNRNRNITRLPHGLGDDIEQNTGYPYTTSDKMTIQIDIIGRNPRTLTVDIDGSIFVGRASMCDVVINESSVSRQQLAIECLNGSLYIQPLDSTTNGTKLNGQLIYDKRQLFSGDKIIIGAVGLIVRW